MKEAENFLCECTDLLETETICNYVTGTTKTRPKYVRCFKSPALIMDLSWSAAPPPQKNDAKSLY